MSLTIDEGQTTTKDPNDISVYTFNWDALLATGAAISTSSWTLTAVNPTTATLITKDQETIPTTRTTKVRISGGTVGALYKVDNQVLTNESPAQTKNRCFYLQIEDR